jgi:hypothetical protein
MFEKLGGRKFVGYCVLMAVSVVGFMVLGKISEPSFIDISKWAFLGYIGGNVADTIASAFVKPELPK